MHTTTAKAYNSFLFGEFPSNNASTKMLNNFAVVGGAFSNNGDSGASDVRIGVGRVKVDTSDVYFAEQNINLYMETSSSKKYSLYRLDIDGLNVTLKTLKSTGEWVQIGGTYTLPSGTEIVMGCAAWTSDLSSRKMSIKDAVCVDVTDISKKASAVNSLNVEEYTPDSWSALKAAQVKAEYSAKMPYLNLVNYADAAITAATDGLVKRMDVANNNIAEFESVNSNAYTAASFEKYQAAYQALVAARDANNLSELDALNAAFVKAQSELVEAVVSIDISWNTMCFSYSIEGAQWDPKTHSYQGEGETQWSALENTNVINVTNNSNVDLALNLEFTPEANYESVTGKFYIDDAVVEDASVIAESESQKILLELEGTAPSEIAENAKGGTVTISVSRTE